MEQYKQNHIANVYTHKSNQSNQINGFEHGTSRRNEINENTTKHKRHQLICILKLLCVNKIPG